MRLPKLCDFYNKYSQVFPNFVALPESKYMFRNIQKKQKLIDDQFQLIQENQDKQQRRENGDHSDTLNRSNRLFTTGFVDSVMKPSIAESPERRPSGVKE